MDGQDDVEELHVLRLQLRQSPAIALNRVCCNALLAAYARARVPQWEKVCTAGSGTVGLRSRG